MDGVFYRVTYDFIKSISTYLYILHPYHPYISYLVKMTDKNQGGRVVDSN